jgi:hypothetical protein
MDFHLPWHGGKNRFWFPSAAKTERFEPEGIDWNVRMWLGQIVPAKWN